MKYFLSLGFLLISYSGFSQSDLIFEVNSNDFVRSNTPLSVRVDQFSDEELSTLVLYEITDGKEIEIPSQLDADYHTLLWFILSGVTPPDSKRTFRITTKTGRKKFPVSRIAMKLPRKLYWDPLKERFKNDDEANAMVSRPQRYPYGTNYVNI